MKKIVLLVLLAFTLVGCNASEENPKYYEKMTLLEEPIYGDTFTFTHQYVLNDKEVLLYAPLYLKIGEKIYTNSEDMYVVRKEKDSVLGYTSYQYSMASREFLERLFGA